MSWSRYVRKRSAAATGLHGFFSNSTLARSLPSAVPSFNVSLPRFNVTMPTVNGKRGTDETRLPVEASAVFLPTDIFASVAVLRHLPHLLNGGVVYMCVSTATSLSTAVWSRARPWRKLAARVTGLHHYFSRNRARIPGDSRARHAAAISEDMMRQREKVGRRLIEEVPISALADKVESEDENGRSDVVLTRQHSDDLLDLMDVEEMARRYFDPT